MRLLLDTHVLLWAISKPQKLPANVRELIEDPYNEVFFSAASIWEIAIKAGLQRTAFSVSCVRVVQSAMEAGFVELPVRSEVAVRVADLPLHHRDPFDRLLVAQAMAGRLRLYTADAQLPLYSDLVTLIG